MGVLKKTWCVIKNNWWQIPLEVLAVALLMIFTPLGSWTWAVLSFIGRAVKAVALSGILTPGIWLVVVSISIGLLLSIAFSDLPNSTRKRVYLVLVVIPVFFGVSYLFGMVFNPTVEEVVREPEPHVLASEIDPQVFSEQALAYLPRVPSKCDDRPEDEVYKGHPFVALPRGNVDLAGTWSYLCEEDDVIYETADLAGSVVFDNTIGQSGVWYYFVFITNENCIYTSSAFRHVRNALVEHNLDVPIWAFEVELEFASGHIDPSDYGFASSERLSDDIYFSIAQSIQDLIDNNDEDFQNQPLCDLGRPELT